MSDLTAGKAKLLQELKDYFQYSCNSEVRRRWRMQYDKNLRLVEGL